MLFMISAYDPIAMYLAIEIQSFMFLLIRIFNKHGGNIITPRATFVTSAFPLFG